LFNASGARKKAQVARHAAENFNSNALSVIIIVVDWHGSGISLSLGYSLTASLLQDFGVNHLGIISMDTSPRAANTPEGLPRKYFLAPWVLFPSPLGFIS
jgi:hypothetical protein